MYIRITQFGKIIHSFSVPHNSKRVTENMTKKCRIAVSALVDAKKMEKGYYNITLVPYVHSAEKHALDSCIEIA